MRSESELAGSYQELPVGTTVVDVVRPAESIALTIHLQVPYSQGEETLNIEEHHSRDALLARNRAEFSPSVAVFEDFADSHGLIMVPEPELRCVSLRGTAEKLCNLFGASLQLHHDGHRRFRARSGSLAVPAEIAPWAHAVLGFDQRPILKRPLRSLASDNDGPGMWPSDIARLYGIPDQADAKGQCIGVIAVGGSYADDDLSASSKNMKRPKPLVVRYGGRDGISDPDADRELALDLQVLAGVAPSARIVVYFTANTVDDFRDTLRTVLADGTNNPQVLSISWGGIEGLEFPEGGCRAIDQILQMAGQAGVTVVAAAGDKLATSGQVDGFAHVLFPASSPSVLACGGTSFKFAADGQTVVDETVWHDQLSGTGGGISDFFDRPDYQQSVSVPASSNGGRVGRGLPDVAAAASKSPGYKVVVRGKTVVEDGTSAATPLWAALIAVANAKRGKPLGSIHNLLYHNPQLFRGIITGNNRVDGIGYDAGQGWNACTGLGVPKGAVTINGLAHVPLTES